MTVLPIRSEAGTRGARMLRTALGPAICGWLDDRAVVEVMLNPDGRLWVDRLSVGIADTSERLSSADGERIVRLVAHHVGVEVHAGAPRISAELPEGGERFEGLLPPVVVAPMGGTPDSKAQALVGSSRRARDHRRDRGSTPPVKSSRPCSRS